MPLSTNKLLANNVAFGGVLVALAAVCSYLEAIIPIPLGIPGVKLGLANIVVVFALYYLGAKQALAISLVRIILLAALFTGPSVALYSLAGGLFSFAIMVVLKAIGKFSLLGVSMAGGAFHNLGQVVIAAVVVKTPGLLLYLAALIPIGLLTGLAIGVLAGTVLNRREFC